MIDIDQLGRRGQTTTELVDEMLIQGRSTAEILEKVPTTGGFISKRTYELKKIGKISGERRGSIVRNQATSNESMDKIHSERMEAYRMLDIPEKQLRIMDKGRVDIQGLLKMRSDARALNHDMLTEEVAKEFRSIAELKEFITFFRDVRSTGVRHSDYERHGKCTLCVDLGSAYLGPRESSG